MARRVTVVALGLAMLLVGPAGAQTAEVEITENLFTPDDVTVRVGAAVHWSSAPDSVGTHNVRQDRRLFRSGQPDRDPIDFTAVFSAGTFHYYCETHGTPFPEQEANMDGFVRVPVTITAGPEGLPFRVRWATRSSETGFAYDVQYRIGSGDWRRWKRDTDALSAVFGRNGAPVRVRPGTNYSFRARSEDGPNASGWSPGESIGL